MYESEKWKWSRSVCPTLRDPTECSLPGSSIHGIFQARVLEWGAIAFSSDQPRQHIKKLFANKGPYSQSYGFSNSHVWMQELDHKEGWPLKNWSFLIVVLEKTPVPWTAKRSNQSALKEINPECSLEGLLLKLKLQYFGHMMPTANSLEKALMLGKIEGRRRRKQKSMRWLYDIIDSKDMSLRKLQEIVKDRQGSLVCCSSCYNSQTQPSDWTTTGLPGLAETATSSIRIRDVWESRKLITASPVLPWVMERVNYLLPIKKSNILRRICLVLMP